MYTYESTALPMRSLRWCNMRQWNGRVARFFLIQYMYKKGRTVPNSHEIYQMAVKKTMTKYIYQHHFISTMLLA
jgi:hypothetical protein